MPSLFEQMQADAGANSAGPSLLDQMRADAAAQLSAGGQKANPSVATPKSGFMMGLRDPVDALAQLAENALPSGVSQKVNQFNNWLADKGLPIARIGEGGVTQLVKDINANYAQNRRQQAQTITGLVTGAQPDPGFDWARLAGNILNPVNALPASRLPAATGLLGRAAVGAAAGAMGGAMHPVTTDGDFWKQKAGQATVGAVTGGVMTPALGAVTDAASKKVASYLAGRADNTLNSVKLDEVLRQVAADTGQKWEDLSPQIQDQMRKQVMNSIGPIKPGTDTAALLRMQDFNAEGIKPTLGQITRDAGQFAQERNLRTMPGVGDPLLQRFMEQGNQLQGKIGAYGAGAQDTFTSGAQLADALKKVDASKSAAVSAAYKAARDAAGKDAEIPLQGLAQDYASVLDSFGDKVPSGVRNQFQKFGLDPASPSNLKKVFTVEEADKVLKVINANQSNDPAVNSALGQLRNAVKSSVTQDAGVEDVFAPARKAAAERFSLHDSVPALQAAATGSTAPDDFVRRFVINGKTNDVQQMAKLLQDGAPDALDQARAQIGAHLQRAAFGENIAGDKAFSAERYAKALRDMGDSKLSAFFSPDEVSQLHRLGRIGAYINSVPNASPVQSSNNWGAIMGVATKIPGIGAASGLIKGAKNVIDNQTGVTRALTAKVPVVPPNLPPEDVRLLARLLTFGGLTGGGAAASAATSP